MKKNYAINNIFRNFWEQRVDLNTGGLNLFRIKKVFFCFLRSLNYRQKSKYAWPSVIVDEDVHFTTCLFVLFLLCLLVCLFVCLFACLFVNSGHWIWWESLDPILKRLLVFDHSKLHFFPTPWFFWHIRENVTVLTYLYNDSFRNGIFWEKRQSLLLGINYHRW